MKNLLALALSAGLTVFACDIHADALSVGADDSIERILVGQKGKRVTLKLGTNDGLTGTVKTVTPQLVHLSELAGKEFFDAAIALKSVTAVIVRVK